MVVRKDLDSTSAILTVTIARETLKPKLDSELKKVRQRVPVKGFRVGHAPMNYIKKLYGPSIFSDTINDLIVSLREEYRVTSIVVTHIMRDALHVGDVFTMLRDGRIIFDGSAAELKATTDPYIKEFIS